MRTTILFSIALAVHAEYGIQHLSLPLGILAGVAVFMAIMTDAVELANRLS